MKLPGTFAAYAAILAIFGQTIAGIHLGLLVINAATTLLVFLLGKRLFGLLAGLVAGASYAAPLSTSPAVVGFAADATNFVVLPAVGGILLLLRVTETRRSWLYFWSGVLLGLAFLMKQPGILFTVFGAVYLGYCERKLAPSDWRGLFRKEFAYACGVVLPFALILRVAARLGSAPASPGSGHSSTLASMRPLPESARAWAYCALCCLPWLCPRGGSGFSQALG